MNNYMNTNEMVENMIQSTLINNNNTSIGNNNYPLKKQAQ